MTEAGGGWDWQIDRSVGGVSDRNIGPVQLGSAPPASRFGPVAVRVWVRFGPVLGRPRFGSVPRPRSVRPLPVRFGSKFGAVRFESVLTGCTSGSVRFGF